MEMKYLLSVAIVLAVVATMSQNVEARRLKLRPLSAQEVYRILKEAGREDAVPEGRVVTQGIAAMTGFALGITKGIGGSLLFDLATSNATSQFINMLSGVNTTSNTNTTYQTQEICFSSRSMEPDLQGRNADYNENDEYGRQATTGTATTSPITTPITSSPATTSSSSSPTSGSGTITTGSGTSGSGTDTGTNSGSGTGTDVDNGTGTNSNTVSTTDTGTGAAQTCIVIQKPKARKRRSSHRRKRH